MTKGNASHKRNAFNKTEATKTILFLSSAGEIAGSEQSLLRFLQFADTTKYRHVTVCCQHGKFPELLGKEKFPYSVIPFVFSLKKLLLPSSLIQNIASTWKLLQRLNDPSVTLVQTNDTLALKFLFLPLLLCRKPLLYHLRNYEWKRLWVIRLLAKKQRYHCIAVSNAIKNHYRDYVGIPDSSISVIHLAEDRSSRKKPQKKEILRKELRLKSGEKLVGLIARFDVWKGHLTLLKAVERALAQCPTLHVVLIGEMMNPETFPFIVEYKAKVLQYASRPGLNGRVHFLGWRDDVPQILPSLDVLVCPSEREPFGRVVLEAFVSAVPVIGADSGGTPEIIEHERNGLLFRTGDDTDLSRCLVRLLNDKRLARRLAREGRTTVEERFTMQQYVRNIERLYSTMIV